MQVWLRLFRERVDCLSFEVMEARNLRTAFAFDKHFEELGFTWPYFMTSTPGSDAAPSPLQKRCISAPR